MTPRRRAMMIARGTAKRYLFRKGRGLLENLNYLIGDNGDSGGSCSEKNIYLQGCSSSIMSCHGVLMLGNAFEWKRWATDSETGEGLYELIGEGIDLSGYTTLYVEMKGVSTNTYQHYIGVIDDNADRGKIRKEIFGETVGGMQCTIREGFSNPTGINQVYSLDISDIEKGMIAILSSKYYVSEIYNIWLE